ncbi:MAG: HTTM domain-containing protein [Sphingobacteriaceae bacterium]|nr:HTTM domain-containing protein [Sphingobacteriaceae bacterium]
MFNDYRYVNESSWLKKLMAFFVLYKCLYWIIDFDLLFSAENIIYHNTVQLPWWKNAVFVLFNHPTPLVSVLFIAAAIAFSLYIVFFLGLSSNCVFLLWLVVSNLNNNAFCTLTGGDSLLQVLLFLCVFLSNTERKENVVLGDLDIAFHNLGITALQIQVCLVYFLNAVAKLADSDWMNGNAVSDTLALHEFSLPFFYQSNTTIDLVLNYTVILYQLLFPLLVWIKKIKKWYLLLGVVQHLYIAFILGLPSFGLIMILAYAAFYAPFKKT